MFRIYDFDYKSLKLKNCRNRYRLVFTSMHILCSIHNGKKINKLHIITYSPQNYRTIRLLALTNFHELIVNFLQILLLFFRQPAIWQGIRSQALLHKNISISKGKMVIARNFHKITKSKEGECNL